MQKQLKKIVSAQKKIATHVYNHRGTYGVAAGIIIGGKIMRDLDQTTYGEAMAFLELKGLQNEFFRGADYDWQEMLNLAK